MKKAFWGISLLLLLFSCRKESVVNLFKSTAYFYSEDGTQILYDATVSKFEQLMSSNYQVMDADVKSFEVLHQDFGRDKKHGFYKDRKLRNVDAATFYWDEKVELPKDRKHVYLTSTETDELPIIPLADPETYERVILEPLYCFRWYKDKNHCYYDHVKTIAHVHTMGFESPYFPYDQLFIFFCEELEIKHYLYTGKVIVESERLVRDDKTIFYTDGCAERIYKNPSKDPSTFTYYDRQWNVYGIDDKVFMGGMRLATELLHRVSYLWLKDGYSKDKGNAYYTTYVIENADVATFEVLSDGYAKDKNQVYEKGEVLKGYEPKDFKEDSWGRYPTSSNYGNPPEESSSSSSWGWGDDD